METLAIRIMIQSINLPNIHKGFIQVLSGSRELPFFVNFYVPGTAVTD